MSDFKSFTHPFSSPQTNRSQQQQQQPGSAQHHGSSHASHHNGYPGNAPQHQQQQQYYTMHGPSHHRPSGSPQPAAAAAASSYSYSPAPAPSSSPMRSAAAAAAPHSSYSSSSSSSSAHTSGAAGHPSSSPPTSEPSLADLRADHARSEHSVSVCEMRLKHCLDSEDERSSSEAARVLAFEKKQYRELTAHLALREKREGAEQRVRGVINSKFDSERALIAERRRQIETAKQRLRNAFALPVGSHAAAGSHAASSSGHNPHLLGTHASPDVPLQSDRASAYNCAGRSPSPSPPASPLPDCSLFDLLPRLRMDVGKAQVALEHQNLRVDSIELDMCVQQAHAAAVAAAAVAGGPGGPGGPSLSSSSGPSSGSSPPAPSSDLASYFKSSRKEVVRHLLDTLAEVDGLTQHIKAAEAFMAYLQVQQENVAEGQQQQQHAAASSASGDAMQH